MVQLTKLVNPVLTKRQWQLIAGTIIGGSSLVKPKNGKHYYLSMRGKDAKWLEYKALLLKDFASFEPFTKERTNRWHSLCFPILDQFADLFYREGSRHLDVEVLSQLWTYGIMVWYKDCGRHDEKQITFNTHVWGEQGSQTVVDYFTFCGWKSEITKKGVKLDHESSLKLFKMIESELAVLQSAGICVS